MTIATIAARRSRAFVLILLLVLSAALAAVLPTPVAAAPGDLIWTRQFGTTGSDQARSVAVAADGSVYAAGSTTGALPGQTSAGVADAFVRKYDTAGTEVWTRQFGTTGTDQALGVAVAANGSIYVAGLTGGALPGQTSAGPSGSLRHRRQ